MHELFDQRRYLIPFRSILLPQIFTDTLVIGSGAAGLTAATAAAQHGDVIVCTKNTLDASNTAWAQGGIAGVLDKDDTTEAHLQDTLTAGAGLCDENMARAIIEEGPTCLRKLIEQGFRADADASGDVHLGREGGHSARRIIHTDGDATGIELHRSLLERSQKAEQIRFFDKCFVLDLLTPTNTPGAPVLGAITHHPKYGLQMIWARATILAAGGAGMLWRETTNPSVATADGLGLAYRAGATLADLEFAQFHPTALYVAGSSRTLISEAVRGEGAHLLDADNNRFMQGEHKLAELAPRDIVSRAILRTLSRTGTQCVYLDARHIEGFAYRFPGIAQQLGHFDLDPQNDLIPVNPASHYMIGGVRTDAHARTNVPGLYAVGEAACTGLHGANRLASNSLLEAVVMGERAGAAAEEMRTEDATGNAWGVTPRFGPVQVISDIPISDHAELDLSDVRTSVRSAMWRNVGIERTGAKLKDVGEMFDFWARYTLDKIFDTPTGWETQNMLLAGSLIARAALAREESVGCHARDDFPETSAEATHTLWQRTKAEPEHVSSMAQPVVA